MCGITGLIFHNKDNHKEKILQNLMKDLFLLSQIRGQDSSGIAFMDEHKITVYKKAIAARNFVHNHKYKKYFGDFLSPKSAVNSNKEIKTIIGQARLVTDGLAEDNQNNQPIIKDGIVGIHNGIIVNHKSLWNQNTSLNQTLDTDTEILLSLFRKELNKGNNISKSFKSVLSQIKGTASFALMLKDYDNLVLGTNNGSLYYVISEKIFIFASEYHTLNKICEKYKNIFSLESSQITRLNANNCLVCNPIDLKITRFDINALPKDQLLIESNPKQIIDKSSYNNTQIKNLQTLYRMEPNVNVPMIYNNERINYLKRCSKCILPETMPFIKFDVKGVCNYCNNYRKLEYGGKKLLDSRILKYKKADGQPDCLVTFSGGRDSSYTLHYLKEILGMNPVAFSYDWGMITNLGRRNQARICGQLGVEHIIISANIRKKRTNIRKNVSAWLKKPELGTIPLFMAGDKQYFYYANKVAERYNLDLIVFGANPLEKTDFKTGFCGILPQDISNPSKVYGLSYSKTMQLLWYYAKEAILNPHYLNSSIFDSLFGFVSYYGVPHDFLYFFSYLEWKEEEIMNVLNHNYDWESSPDTKSSWRLVDGTTAFYNFIYYHAAGFTENETFRSNQIREGFLDRSTALKLVETENQPRFSSIKWYCDTIGIDFEQTIKRILSMKFISKI